MTTNSDANSGEIDTLACAFFAMTWIMCRNCSREPATILWARRALDVLLVGVAEDAEDTEAALIAIESELADMRAGVVGKDAAADGALLGLADRVAEMRRRLSSPSTSVH